MTTTFFCKGPDRSEIAGRCLMRWLDHVETDIEYLYCVTPEMNRERRIIAENRANVLGHTFYIVADDDCLVPRHPWIEAAIDILADHPEYAMLSLWPKNCSIAPWRPSGITAHEDDDVLEMHSVGGVRVCRSMVLWGTGWPEQDPSQAGYDRIHCDALRALGYRTGYFKNIFMHHLGEGESTIWQQT